MSYVEIETGRYVKRWAFWNPATWSIPKLYWDAWSQEQRLHAICRQLEKVIKYADYLGVNVDDIAARLKAIEDGQLDEVITAAIEQWFEDNEPAIIGALQNLQKILPANDFSAENTVKDAIDALSDEDADLQRQITENDENVRQYVDDKTKPEPKMFETVFFDYIAQTIQQSNYNNMQGGCYIGNNMFVYYLDTAKKLMKINISGMILTETPADIGHGNSLCFDGSYIYAYGDFTSTNVYKIDPVSLNVIQTINTGLVFSHAEYNAWAIVYDDDNDLFHVTGDGSTDRSIIATFDKEFNFIEENPFYFGIGCNVLCETYHDGKIYFVTSRLNKNVLSVYDISKKQVISNCLIDEFANTTFINEFESLSFVDDELYALVVSPRTDIAVIIKQALGKMNRDTQLNPISYTVYVNPNTTEPNYCIGTSDYPFTTISQASGLAKRHNTIIEVMADCDSVSQWIYNIEHTLTISGHGYSIGLIRPADFKQLIVQNATITGVECQSAQTAGTIVALGISYASQNPTWHIQRCTVYHANNFFQNFENVSMAAGGQFNFVSDSYEFLVTSGNVPTTRPSGNCRQITGFGYAGGAIGNNSYIPCGTYIGSYNNTTYMFGSTGLSGTYSISLARDGGWFKCTSVNLPPTNFYKVAD